MMASFSVSPLALPLLPLLLLLLAVHGASSHPSILGVVGHRNRSAVPQTAVESSSLPFDLTAAAAAAAAAASSDEIYRLPDGFMLGAGTSSYQIEGAWNEDGKGESQIDHALHTVRPGFPNGDVAIDSYHKYKEDVAILKQLKLNAYRFSLSWSRLLPTGGPDNVNQAGVRYYHNLLDELNTNNITPVVTLYHLEHPQVLEDRIQAWLSPKMIDSFVEYARFAFETFGDKVKWWTTINEPHIYCMLVYGYGIFPPSQRSPGRNEYLCGHHMVLAHARAYNLYRKRFAHNGGQVGISYESYFARPKSLAYEDVLAAERRNVFELAWTLDPLLRGGEYPPLMRRLVDGKSRQEGLPESRLPTFTDAEKKEVGGALDFVGLNSYFGTEATDGVLAEAGDPSMDRDAGVLVAYPGEEPTSVPGHSHSTPWAIRESLLWLKNRYGDDVRVMVTESGFGKENEEGLDDVHREQYFSDYLREMLRAMHVDKCNVIGFIAWSLLDSFEWESYDVRFGLVHVDHASPNKTRTPKRSAEFLRRVMTERVVPEVAGPTSGSTSGLTSAPSMAATAFASLLALLLLPRRG